MLHSAGLHDAFTFFGPNPSRVAVAGRIKINAHLISAEVWKTWQADGSTALKQCSPAPSVLGHLHTQIQTVTLQSVNERLERC